MSIKKTFILREECNAKALWAFLKSNWRECASVGQFLQVSITVFKDKRSIEQNKRYWAILRHIAESAWVAGKTFSQDGWHENFKRIFIGCIDLPNGEKMGMSTTDLKVDEFGEYMAKVEAYAAMELGVEFMGAA